MNSLKLRTVLALLISGQIGRADPLDTWTLRSPLPSANGLHGIVYGNGEFVAVGAGGVILTSADGVNWVLRQPPTVNALSGIAYSSGQFVAVGDTGTIVTSADGLNWVQRQSGTSITLLAIAYGNGHFVAVGTGGTILQSGSIITLAITPKAGTGLLSLSLEGPTGLAYTIQSSTDLISWRNLTNITSAQGTNIIRDALPAASERVFYRAYSQ